MIQRKKSDKGYCSTCKYWSGDTKLSGDMVYNYDDDGDCQNSSHKCGRTSKNRCSCLYWVPKY